VVALSGPSLVILAAGRARRYGGTKQLAPIGKHGEAVIDLIASDAFAAGFDDVVLVVNADTGPEIKAHIDAHWPKSHKISYVVQQSIRGTLDAVLTAKSALDITKPFGVSNADDVYGRESFAQLGRHLSATTNSCLVGFELDKALVGNLPVSRGTCNVVNNHLTDIVERRNVQATLDGYVADDGLEPRVLHPRSIVSMNLWGFQPAIWPLMEAALEKHDFAETAEIQLSTFVGSVLHRVPMRFDVLATTSRCIGVTHADDLPLAQNLVIEEIASGDRPEFAFA